MIDADDITLPGIKWGQIDQYVRDEKKRREEEAADATTQWLQRTLRERQKPPKNEGWYLLAIVVSGALTLLLIGFLFGMCCR